MVRQLQAEVHRLRGLLALNKMSAAGGSPDADVAASDRSFRRSRAGRVLASGLQRSSYQRLSASEPDLPSPRAETAAARPPGRRRQPLTRAQATELPETPAAERPSPIGAEQTSAHQPAVTAASSSSQLSLVSGDSELWDELRGITCERERRCWANFLLWEQRRGLYRPASVPGNMHRLSEERRSRRQVVREVVRRLYPGGGGGGVRAPPGDAAEPDWCCCGRQKRRREASSESRPYEKRSRIMEEEEDEKAERRRRKSSGGRSPAVGALSSSTPNVARFPRLRERASDPIPAAAGRPSSQRDLSQCMSVPATATLSCSVDEGLGGSFDVCAPPVFSDDSLEPSDFGISRDSLDMIDADSVEDLTVGKQLIDSLFHPTRSVPVVAVPVLPQPRQIEHWKHPPEATEWRRTPPLESHRKSPQVTGSRRAAPSTIIRISMVRPTVSSESEWGSPTSSLDRRQVRAARADVRRRAEERFSCSGASDSEGEQRFVSAADTAGLLSPDAASDSISFHSAAGEPDGWSAWPASPVPPPGNPVIHFPSPPPPEVFVDEYEPPDPPTPSPGSTGVHPLPSAIDSGEVNGDKVVPSEGSPTAACRLYTIVESAGESDGAIDSRASPGTHARPPAAPAMARKHGAGERAASAAPGGRSVLARAVAGDGACDAGWTARWAAAEAPAAAACVDADMWERYVSRLDVRSHLLLEEARRRPGIAVSLLVRSRSLPELGPERHVSRLYRSALSVTVHGRTPPPAEQRLLYSLPPEVRERATIGPPVESIPEHGDGTGSENSHGSQSSGSSAAGSRKSSGSDGAREESDGGPGVEERVTAALDDDDADWPAPGSSPVDPAGTPAQAAQSGDLSDAPAVFSDSSGDAVNRGSQPTAADADISDERRVGAIVTSESSTERLTRRVESTETHRESIQSGPRILTYEIVEEVNVFVRGSGETHVSTSRSASVTRVPAEPPRGDRPQADLLASRDTAEVVHSRDGLEQSSQTQELWDYRTEVLHLSPRYRQTVTSTLDAETRVRRAPAAEAEADEEFYPAESGAELSEPPSLEFWEPEDSPSSPQDKTAVMARDPSEEAPSLEPWDSEQPASLEQQPPSLESWTSKEAVNLNRQLSEEPPSLELWESDQPPSLEQWAPEEAPLSEQRAPSVDSPSAQETDTPATVCAAPPLNITVTSGAGVTPGSLPCRDPVTEPGCEADGFQSGRATADELSPSAPARDTHGRVPPSPFRLITNMEDEEVHISSRSGRSVSRGRPSARDVTSISGECVTTTTTTRTLVMTRQGLIAPTAPLNTVTAVCDPQTATDGHRPESDCKAAAVVHRPPDESRIRPAAAAPDIDEQAFVDRRTSSEGIRSDEAIDKNFPEVDEPAQDSLDDDREISYMREPSLSPDKIERWSCDPPAIFVFEVEEHGALLRRDDTRFIDADAEAERQLATESDADADNDRSPRTPVEEQFFFFKTTEEEPSLETIAEEIVEAFDESSSSTSSSSSSSHSKNTSRDVDDESLRSDLSGASGNYEVNSSAAGSASDAGSPRQKGDKNTDQLPKIVEQESKQISEEVASSNGDDKSKKSDDQGEHAAQNLMDLSIDESSREASDPRAADVSKSGPGETPRGSADSMSSNVQADRDLEEVSGRLEVMPSPVLLSKAESEGDESGAMAEPRSGSPRLPETPERPDGAARDEEAAEEVIEIEKTAEAEAEPEAGLTKMAESDENGDCQDIHVPKEAWLETTPAVPELSHAVSVEECEEFQALEELAPLPLVTADIHTPMEMVQAKEDCEDVEDGELFEIPELVWKYDSDDDNRNENIPSSIKYADPGRQKDARDFSETPNISIPSDDVTDPGSHQGTPKASPSYPTEDLSEPATTANRPAMFEESQVTSSDIDLREAQPATAPIDTAAAASDPHQIVLGTATEITEEDMQGPAVGKQTEILCYPDDRSEALNLELEQLQEDIDKTDEQKDDDQLRETHDVLEIFESIHQYSEVQTVTENVLACPDSGEVTPMELEELECDAAFVGEHEEDRPDCVTDVTIETKANVVEDDLQGPAREALVEILCFSDDTSEAPELLLEQVDVIDDTEVDDKDNDNDKGSTVHGQEGETQQAVQSEENESTSVFTVNTSTVLCLAQSTATEDLPEESSTIAESTLIDAQPTELSEMHQAVESITDDDINLQVEENKVTVLCYADDREAETLSDIEDLCNINTSEESEHDVVLPEDDNGIEHIAAEVLTSGATDSASEIPTINVLCAASSNEVEPEEISLEVLEIEESNPKPQNLGQVPSKENDDQDAVKLAEAIVSHVMNKATDVLGCSTELSTDQNAEKESELKEMKNVAEQVAKEADQEKEILHKSEALSPEMDDLEEGFKLLVYTEDEARKTFPEIDEQASKEEEAIELSDQVVSAASDVHTYHHSEDVKCGEIINPPSDKKEMPDDPKSDISEPEAVKLSAYVCGSEQSLSENEADSIKEAQSLSTQPTGIGEPRVCDHPDTETVVTGAGGELTHVESLVKDVTENLAEPLTLTDTDTIDPNMQCSIQSGATIANDEEPTDLHDNEPAETAPTLDEVVTENERERQDKSGLAENKPTDIQVEDTLSQTEIQETVPSAPGLDERSSFTTTSNDENPDVSPSSCQYEPYADSTEGLSEECPIPEEEKLANPDSDETGDRASSTTVAGEDTSLSSAIIRSSLPEMSQEPITTSHPEKDQGSVTEGLEQEEVCAPNAAAHGEECGDKEHQAEFSSSRTTECDDPVQGVSSVSETNVVISHQRELTITEVHEEIHSELVSVSDMPDIEPEECDVDQEKLSECGDIDQQIMLPDGKAFRDEDAGYFGAEHDADKTESEKQTEKHELTTHSLVEFEAAANSESQVTSDELERQLLEEVNEQTPSLDTVGSLQNDRKCDQEEIFYSFDTEDEAIIGGMETQQRQTREPSSLLESEDLTEVTIKLTNLTKIVPDPQSEDDSTDSSSDTPRIHKDASEVGERTDLTSANQEPPKNTETKGTNASDYILPSNVHAGQETRATRENPQAGSLIEHSMDLNTISCREEPSLTSFSDVSQVRPIILSRPQCMSLSDDSEADDWSAPPPPVRQQPVLKLDTRPRTSLGELDGALSPRETVPQPPVSRPLRALTPSLTDITETEGDTREEPIPVAATIGALSRYSHNFGDEDMEQRARSSRSGAAPTADKKVQMWQQYVELQHVSDEEPSPPQPLSTSDIMYLYIGSATGFTSTSELSDIGLSAAVPRSEHRASAVRLERTVSADCVRRQYRDGLARCSSADGLLQRGRPPMDIANIIALGRLPLSSSENQEDEESDERGRGKKCVSWSDLHGSGELEVVHGSPEAETPQRMETQSDSEESSSGEESEEERDLVVGRSHHQHLPAEFGLTMPDEVRRRSRRYLPQPARSTQLETANWDLIGQDVGIPLVEERNAKRLVNASTQTSRDSSSQTDDFEELAPKDYPLDSSQQQYPQLPNENRHSYSSFSNYDNYPTTYAYDRENSFNNPNLRSDSQYYNFHTSSAYEPYSRNYHSSHTSYEPQRYSFEYRHRHLYPEQSTPPLNTASSRVGSLENQIYRELEALRQERERSRGHWDGDMERHRRLLHVEDTLQKSLQQMRALVARRRARARILMETLPPFSPGSRHARIGAASPVYRQTTVVPSAGGLEARLADIVDCYDKTAREYGAGALEYAGRLREAPSVTHILHQDIHVPPCCSHAAAAATRPAPAGSPRRMTPSQYREHLAGLRRRILAQPPASAAQPPPPAALPTGRARATDPWGPAPPARPVSSSAVSHSEPDLSRAGGVWRSSRPSAFAGSTGHLSGSGGHLLSADASHGPGVMY